MKKLLVQHKILLTLLLFLLTSIVSIYVTDLANGHIWSYLGMGTDGRFHVVRMQGLYESIKQGTFLPIVNMSALGGFGYISNVFYSNLWLYPVALLRLISLPMAQSFVIYYILLNFCTFLTSFFAYFHVSRRYDKSLVFSFIYTLGTYRIFDMVRRFDIGEVLTLTFLPIVVLGVYEIFYGREKEWLYLTLGMVAVIYSHALSPILIMIFIVLVIAFRMKTLIREPKRIWALIKAGLVSLALSLAYFLPILEQLKHTQFKLTSPLVDVAQRSVSVPNLFKWSLTNDMNESGIGLILILAAIMVPFTIWKVKNPAVRDFTIIGIILLFMTTNLFPWNIVEKTPLKMIQFPWRLNMIITILLAIFLASDSLNWFEQNWKKAILMVAAVGLTFNSEYVLIQNFPREDNSYANFDNIDTYSIGIGEEYLPKTTNLNQLRKTSHQPQIASGKATLSHFKKVGSKLSFEFKNADNAKINLPIIGYYGYSSKGSTGRVSKVIMGKNNNGLGQVKVTGNGVVRVNYDATFIQKSSKVVSITALIILIFTWIFKKKRMKN